MSMTAYKYNEVVQLTKNWRTTEFKCKGKGHTHDTLINLELVKFVQSFMDKYGIVRGDMSSGYRCAKHSVEIGSSKTSKHTTQGAMDVCFKDKNGKIIPSIQICCWAQDFGFKGIARIDKNYVHLDLREGKKWYGDETKGNTYTIPTGDFYKYFGIKKDNVSRETYQGQFPALPNKHNNSFVMVDKSDQVGLLQKFLNWALDTNLDVDNSYGPATCNKVKEFQKKVGIKVDGYFGKSSLEKAKEFTK